jgi:hypothetical protein
MLTKKTLLVAVALLVPSAARAQIAWDTPLLIAPNEAPGWGLYLAEVYGGDLGVIGTWRSPSWNFGVRGGLAEANDGDLGILAGIDFSGALVRATAEFPLDVDWVFGGGIGTGNGVRISLPAGLIVGYSFPAEGVTFTPYASPRVMLDAFIDRETAAAADDGSDAELAAAVDLGLDLRLRQGFTIRFGATLGDHDGVAIGIVF